MEKLRVYRALVETGHDFGQQGNYTVLGSENGGYALLDEYKHDGSII